MEVVWLAAAGALSLLLIALNLITTFHGRRQKLMRRSLKLQGIGGPPPSLLRGNVPDIIAIASSRRSYESRSGPNGDGDGRRSLASDYFPSLFPHLDRWRELYGPIFTYSTGSIQVINVSDMNIVKEIGQYKSLNLGKPSYLQKEFGPLFGHGIITSNGTLWAHQRKIIAPEFFMEKVKGMIGLMVAAMEPLCQSWLHQMECGGGTAEILVDDELRSFSADVISRACFGSSYFRGKEVFSKLRELQKAIAAPGLLTGILGLSCLSAKSNRDIWKMEGEIRLLILGIVKERKDMVNPQGKDLLQSILDNADSDVLDPDLMESFIVDNCKNIYFAGHETTAISATWCLMLLAVNPDWQVRARFEVQEICKGQLPDSNKLKGLKVLTMVIQEALRLYPVAPFATREALEDMKLGDILIPRGIDIKIPIPTLHRDPGVWGPDAHEFKPERFSRGISGACKLPHAYIPFGLGGRSCVGQNLAMVELKVALSIILSQFTFSLSPAYRHSPVFRLTVEPEFGMPLIMRKL